MQYDALTRAIYLQYRRSSTARRPPCSGSCSSCSRRSCSCSRSATRAARAYHRRPGRGSAAARAARSLALAGARVLRRVVGLFLVVPLAVLVYWSARESSSARSTSPGSRPRSTRCSRPARRPRVAVVAAFPVAFLADRYPRWWTRALERLAYSANALPGIVIALSLVFFAARYGGRSTRRSRCSCSPTSCASFPQALAGTASALQRVGPRVEEAARGLGRGAAGAVRPVTAPLVAPGHARRRGARLPGAMKELPATLLLRPIGFDTLATEIWEYTALGAYSRAAPPALLLIVRVRAVRLLLGPDARSELGSSRVEYGRWRHGHSVDEYLETIYFLAFPIGEYGRLGLPDARLARRGDARRLAGLGRRDAQAARGRGPDRARRAQGGDPHRRRRERAEKVVRKHRIVERLLTDFMGYTAAEAHVHADELGDTFSDDMVERIAERLGTPDRCPHGWPVDPAFEQAENGELAPLAELEPGKRATIVRLAEHDGDLLHWFYDEGFVPGTKIELRETRSPAAGQLTVKVNGREQAIGKGGRGAFVRPRLRRSGLRRQALGVEPPRLWLSDRRAAPSARTVRSRMSSFR